LLEEDQGVTLDIKKGKCKLDVGPFEIVTLKLLRK
jgi:hypothetical protein